MTPAEWMRFVAENKEQLVDQLRVHLPEAEFTNIAAGLPPSVVYLQQRHGLIELGLEAIRLELDDVGRVSGVETVEPGE